MIHGLFGMAHVGLSHFHSMCESQKMSYAIAHPEQAEKIQLGAEHDPFPVITLSAVNFLKTYRKFKKRDVCLFVIDNPVQLEAIGATILGCTKIQSYLYRFHPLRPQDIKLAIDSCNSTPLEIKIKPTRVIHDLLTVASAESILSPVQTAFYTVKDLETRTAAQDAVFDWLAGRLDAKKVLSSVKHMGEKSPIVQRLSAIIEDKKFLALRKACTAALNGDMKIEKAAATYKVPLYDTKYVCKKTAAKMGITLPG